MSMAMGKQGIMASIVGMVSSVFKAGGHIGTGVATGGFNNQTVTIGPPRFRFDSHISPAMIRRRPGRISGHKKKTNRLHLSRKAKVARRKTA